MRFVPPPKLLIAGLPAAAVAIVRELFSELSVNWFAHLGPMQSFLDWRWSGLTLAAVLFGAIYTAWFLQENTPMGKKRKKRVKHGFPKNTVYSPPDSEHPTAVRGNFVDSVIANNRAIGFDKPMRWFQGKGKNVQVTGNVSVAPAAVDAFMARQDEIITETERTKGANERHQVIMKELDDHYLHYGLLLRNALKAAMHNEQDLPWQGFYENCNEWYRLAKDFIDKEVSKEEGRLFSSDAGLTPTPIEVGTAAQRRHYATLDCHVQRLQSLIQRKPWLQH